MGLLWKSRVIPRAWTPLDAGGTHSYHFHAPQSALSTESRHPSAHCSSQVTSLAAHCTRAPPGPPERVRAGRPRRCRAQDSRRRGAPWVLSAAMSAALLHVSCMVAGDGRVTGTEQIQCALRRECLRTRCSGEYRLNSTSHRSSSVCPPSSARAPRRRRRHLQVRQHSSQQASGPN